MRQTLILAGLRGSKWISVAEGLYLDTPSTQEYTPLERTEALDVAGDIHLPGAPGPLVFGGHVLVGHGVVKR